MSKHQRKPAKPISANPLFPAVVALWFSAAFGLSTLAVGATAIENLVLKSHIDLIVPAAAPPLGLTARILLALVLAAVGAVLGIVSARLYVRPKPELRERKRGARDLGDESPQLRQRDSHPDAPARRPISAHEELGEDEPLEPARPVGGMLAGRRRALAMMDQEAEFVPHDAAPLPGLDGVVQPLDLAALALPVDTAPQAEAEPAPATYAPPAAPAPSLDWTRPAIAPVEAPPITAEAAHRDGRQVFGMTPPPAPDTAPRQIFGIEAAGDNVPQDFVKVAGFQTTVFERAAQEEAVTTAAPIAQVEVAQPQPAEPLPSPSSLSMTDLAARLADSMRRRRKRAQASPAVPSSLAPIAAEPVPVAAAAVAAAGPALTVPPMAELPIMPAAFAAPIAAPAPVPEAPAAPSGQVLPRFTEARAPSQVAPAPAPLDMPAAMRPLALDAFLEDDAALDASLLPPRHIAMPAAPPQPAAFAAPEAEEGEAAGETTLADNDEDNPYASLLAVTPQRQAPVRIDEFDPPPGAEIEPVVIFPGQSGQIVSLPSASPASDEGGFRRFDAPGSAGQGQPVAASSNPSLIPAEEAAQALRAALSNLQRMSGAA